MYGASVEVVAHTEVSTDVQSDQMVGAITAAYGALRGGEDDASKETVLALFGSVPALKAASQLPTNIVLTAQGKEWAQDAAVGGCCASMPAGATAMVWTMLAVHPEWQRSGVAAKLMAAMEHAAVAKGAATLEAEVCGKELRHYFVKRGYGARFPTEIYTRGCHRIPRMFS
jgi:GNAT superfamily N-acetyltransferase